MPKRISVVTAELGTNWLGNYVLLQKMAKAAKLAGVKYVKLQALSPELLERHKELEYYADSSVNKSNIHIIDKVMRDVGIEWYASVTYPEAAEMLAPYMDNLKIRVADNENMDILDACAKVLMDKDHGRKDPKLFVSSLRPLPQAYYDRWPDLEIINLYCIPRYPTQYGEINFNMMGQFEFEGYSNHCTNPLAILKAYRKGAKYLEFHLTSDKGLFALDNPVSFDYGEMLEIMQWIR